jgi:hypothetical protein
MPEFALDYHRRKVPIDHPDGSITGGKFSVDIVSTITSPTAFPGLWGFSGVTKNALLGKVMQYWGGGINTEDKFWPYFYMVSDEGSFRRLLNTIGDIVSVIGSPSITIKLLGYGLVLYLYRSADCQNEGVYLTDYVLSDIDIYWYMYGVKGVVLDRSQSIANFNNMYEFDFDTGAVTADYKIGKTVNGTGITLATEAVDLSTTTYYKCRATIVGSTLSFYRDGVLRLQATDTSFASGVMGIHRHNVDLNWMRIYRKAYGTVKGILTPQAIIEVEAEGSGSISPEDPYRPKIKSNLASIDLLTGLPEYLYSQKDIQQQVNLDAVSWGAFEFSDKSSTNIIMVYGDNPYKSGAVDRQIDHAKSRNLRAFTPPKDYSEVVSLYNRLKGDFNHWLAGKDNFAYMVLGDESLDLFQNVDFYYGELLEHKTHYDQLKNIKDLDLSNRLNELKDKLSKVNVLIDERDKHLGKLNEILRKGW